jgi:rhomboid protease GluP
MSRACPHCSATLPDFTDAYCPHCNGELPPELRAPPPEPLAPPNPAVEFIQALRALTPRVVVTPVLVLLNVLVFIGMVASGADVMDPKIEDLVNWGANFGPQTLDGEWWRLLSAAFVHIGAVHLALNMLVLAGIGPMVERMLGGPAFALVYVASALGGSLASLLWNPVMVSAGASGAVFGAFGGLLGVLLVQRRSVPPAAHALLKQNGIGFLGYNLVIGFLLPNVDFAAHIGGLLFGFALGALCSRPLTVEGATGRRARVFVGGWVAFVAVVGFALLVATVRPSAAAAVRELEQFEQLERRVIERYNTAYDKLTRGELQEAALLDLLAREMVPDWRAQRERLGAHADAPGDLGKHVSAVVEYMRLRERGWEELVAAARTNDAARAERAHALRRQADEAAKRLTAPPKGGK